MAVYTRKSVRFIRRFSLYPAQTIIASFVLVILAGAVLLALPPAVAAGRGLRPVDALFTATSAVCVTGLTVLDTSADFSVPGQAVILALIQVGGLGIMLLSFFAGFTLNRPLSMEGKLLISYMLNERDMTHLRDSVRRIILITFAVELAGAALLFACFRPQLGWSLKAAFFSLFHAVSAFCNAGFSLFPDGLAGYVSRWPLNIVICLLIISGGLSFPVLINLAQAAGDRLPARLRKRRRRALSLNSRIVLGGTAVLLAAGTILFYALEHGHTLRAYGLGTQYLAAFFQSVTLRTAGFNTVPISRLRDGTYLFMILFMFIGAAAGSTAGGVKINSVALVLGYLRSTLRNRDTVTLYRFSVSPQQVQRAFLIVVSGAAAVAAGCLVLTLTETADFIRILFEAVSAFGTVGLSTGITPSLSDPGKVVIILLMFMGRVGPLTLLAAAGRRKRAAQIEYPQGEIVTG